ncbi:MAG: hypothetical protein HQK96_17620, partial [Nitrospirae bacterium]|nr:hypothetical protein [Nitrospirota bacterium]
MGSKKGFWAVLEALKSETKSKRPSPEAIANEIRSLKARIPELEAASQAAHENVVTLRQKSLGGGTVSEGEFSIAQAARQEISLDLEAATKALVELEKSLREVLQANIEAEAVELEAERVKLLEEKWQFEIDHAKALAAVVHLENHMAVTPFPEAFKSAPFVGTKAFEAYHEEL